MLAEHGLSAEIAAFIDDLGNGGHDHDSTSLALGRLLTALEHAHFMVGADKIWAGYSSLSFLGYHLAGGVLHPDPERVAAISRLVPPSTRS